MAPNPPQQKAKLGNVLVIGGCGFLGHHIVDLLLSNHYTATVSVLDLATTANRRPTSDGVQYYEGDITALEDGTATSLNPKTGEVLKKPVAGLLPIFNEVKPDVVIHTASPSPLAASKELHRKVNVDGTKCVIEACQKTGVKALVYTCSASIVSDNAGTDLINADERWPVMPAEFQKEYYSLTKAEAESHVLSANRSPSHSSLLTCSLRPAGIFGPDDALATSSILNLYTKTKRTNWQIGPNTNLFDFTFVTNVAHAHVLASQALLATSALSLSPLDHEKIDGEAFFITNDSPIPFWDFARAIWKAAGCKDGTEHVWVLSKEVGLAIGGVLESFLGLVGRKPNLTTNAVKYACMTRYYDIGKAKRRLGYEPLVPLGEGIERAVRWFLEKEEKEERERGEKM